MELNFAPLRAADNLRLKNVSYIITRSSLVSYLKLEKILVGWLSEMARAALLKIYNLLMCMDEHGQSSGFSTESYICTGEDQWHRYAAELHGKAALQNMLA